MKADQLKTLPTAPRIHIIDAKMTVQVAANLPRQGSRGALALRQRLVSFVIP